ncbi:MAG: signal peptide prediction [Steroidobacteraceae bacterium]
MIRRFASYAWASPNSLLGLIAGLAMLCFGGRVQWVRHCAEFSGGLIGSLFVSRAIDCRFRAITLGHVVLGTDKAALSAARAHEHVHVRQYERWGPFFLPAYVVSSLWQAIIGRRCYRDNYFERQAFAAVPNRRGSP